ncbi:hypothetical protein HOY80DRAFT_704007 [Tuber brumale]|nr:hypothetical protein HOY80DRAFT_704007 [Tuber brumale]
MEVKACVRIPCTGATTGLIQNLLGLLSYFTPHVILVRTAVIIIIISEHFNQPRHKSAEPQIIDLLVSPSDSKSPQAFPTPPPRNPILSPSPTRLFSSSLFSLSYRYRALGNWHVSQKSDDAWTNWPTRCAGLKGLSAQLARGMIRICTRVPTAG